MFFFSFLFWVLKLIYTLLTNCLRLTLAGPKTEYQNALCSHRISGVIMRLFQSQPLWQGCESLINSNKAAIMQLDFNLELLGLFSAFWRLYWKNTHLAKEAFFHTVLCWRGFFFSLFDKPHWSIFKKKIPGASYYHVSPFVCKVVKGVFISFLLLSKTLSRVSCSLVTPGMRLWQSLRCWNFFRLNPRLSAFKLFPLHISPTVALFLTASW